MLTFFLHKNKNVLVFILLISISTLFVTTQSSSAQKQISNAFSFLGAPFIWLFHEVGGSFSSTFEDVIYFKEKLAEMEKLEKTLLKRQELFTDIQQKNEEIANLKAQLGYKQLNDNGILFIDDDQVMPNKSQDKIETADIVMKDPESSYQTLIINKGSYRNIKEKMPVIAIQKIKKPDGSEVYDRVVVGKISQTSYLHSKILPITNPACKIYVKLKDSGSSGYLSGQGSIRNSLILRDLDKKTLISKNEEIITSGNQSIFPKGIKVGYVEKDISDKASYMKRARITPYVNLSKLETVIVIKKEISQDLKSLIEKK